MNIGIYYQVSELVRKYSNNSTEVKSLEKFHRELIQIVIDYVFSLIRED